MSLEAWGDGGGGWELSARDEERIDERAREKACEADETGDDPPLELPDDVSLDAIELTEITASGDDGWRFQASYGGRSVEVLVPFSLLEPDDEP